MVKVVVLGAGVMGTAITIPLADNDYEVHLVGTHLDGDIIEEIHENQTHPKLQTPVPDQVTPHPIANLCEAMSGADYVVLGVNSLGTEWAATVLAEYLSRDIPVIAVTKGLAGDGRRIFILPDVFRARLPLSYREEIKLTAIGGPSIASELAARHHTSIVVAGTDQSHLNTIAKLLQTQYYHICTTTDLIGTEICVAMKNLYSLGVGLAYGLQEKQGLGKDSITIHNMPATIFTQGLHETTYLVESFGGDVSSVYSLPGAGDFYVTAQGGRNVKMGRLLGAGMSFVEARSHFLPDETIEGVELAEAIGLTIDAMITRGSIDGDKVPLLCMLIDLVCNGEPTQIPWDFFFS